MPSLGASDAFLPFVGLWRMVAFIHDGSCQSSDRVWILVVNHTGPRLGGGWLCGQRLLPHSIFFLCLHISREGHFIITDLTIDDSTRANYWGTRHSLPLRRISCWVRSIISRISIKRRWLQNAGLRNELCKLQFSFCHIWGPLTRWWLKVDVFLDETPCSLVKACRLFGVKSILTNQYSNLNSIIHSIIRITYRYHFHCASPYHYQCVSPYRCQCISPYRYQ
jgi:hypothetical protein